MPNRDRRNLTTIIAQTALRLGPVELSSGQKSYWYVDKYLLTTDPDILVKIALGMARYVPLSADRLAGPELGSVPIMAVISTMLRKPYAIVRKAVKPYGTAKLVEGTVEEGEEVVVIEDAVTTGAETMRTIGVIESKGAKVILVIAILDRQEGGADRIEKAGYPFVSLVTREGLGVIAPDDSTTQKEAVSMEPSPQRG